MNNIESIPTWRQGKSYCGNCGKRIPQKIKAHYCHKCGAKILWEKAEENVRWIYGEDKTGVDGWRCSKCNFFEPWFYEYTDDIDFIKKYHFCPGCGYHMNFEKEGEIT